ncbi:MAG TPA: hypothetical protein VJ276_18025 [Thermoanaerobaculia bacterium]|nr:hypothetical protein [Thermoanaerobaculia bacterium]
MPVEVGGEKLRVELPVRRELVGADREAVTRPLLMLAVEAVVIEVELLDLLHAAGGVGVEAKANGAWHINGGGRG